MKYYRLALYNSRTGAWCWTTTVLTSLQSVLHVLRGYSSLPQDRIRVFTAEVKEELQMMLRNENEHVASGSVTAAQFLRERRLKMNTPESAIPAQDASGKDNVVNIEGLPVFVASAPLHENDRVMQPYGEGAMSFLESRRLSMELGPGGDCNRSYLFSLPLSTPQLLAWTRLRARVQAGELQP
jgi:hypothetical protein